MSTYERYELAANHYDRTRGAKGLDIILGCLAGGGKPLGEVELLDAGCGTGLYTAALQDHVARIAALDLNEGMLAVARRKLGQAEAAGKVAFHQGSIAAMPFSEQHFDAVIFNQVLHHLEDGTDTGYHSTAKAVAEAYRVLRPGGAVMINACSHEQLSHGFWYYGLVPNARAGVLARCAPAGRLREILNECGFQFRNRHVPLDSVMQGDAYFDATGPLKPEWRKGDSYWALATAEELAAAEARIEKLSAEDGLEQYFVQSDAPRAVYGQLTFFHGVKPDKVSRSDPAG